tara:strand:- start:23 stop:499 length:477 start_codon:yes stop_codon:yes gene_type:complete
MGKVSTILVAILLLSSQIATASEPYDFVLAIVESFQQIEIAKERIQNSDDPSMIIFVKDMIVFNDEMEMATNEEVWRLLPMTTVQSTYLLIDPKRTIGGKLKYLKINSKERRQLINKLESVFGDKVKGGLKAGQLPVETSAATLWKVLNDPWKSSDSD